MPGVTPERAIRKAIADYDQFFRERPDFDITKFRQWGQAREANVKAEKIDFEVQVLQGRYVLTEMVMEIRDETVKLLNNYVGPALASRLSQYNVPADMVDELNEQLYDGLVNIYLRYRAGSMPRGILGAQDDDEDLPAAA